MLNPRKVLEILSNIGRTRASIGARKVRKALERLE
jgi:hypothetical protein